MSSLHLPFKKYYNKAHKTELPSQIHDVVPFKQAVTSLDDSKPKPKFIRRTRPISSYQRAQVDTMHE
jgi:hypothetical protein